MNLVYFLDERGDPMPLQLSKEPDDNFQAKHDAKDAKDALVIASMVRDGRFIYLRLLKE